MSLKRFEQQASTCAIQLKQAAQAGNHAQFADASRLAQRFQHLSGLHHCNVQPMFEPACTLMLSSHAVHKTMW